MTTEDANSDAKAPQGWAIIGAFLGVLFGYIGTTEFSSQIGTVAIIAAGMCGAIVMNEIEYQIICNTGTIRTNLNGLKNSATADSNNSNFVSDIELSISSPIYDQLYNEDTSDVNDIGWFSEDRPKSYFVKLELSNDELMDFVHENQEQLRIYPSLLIAKETFDEGLILINPALLSKSSPIDVSKAIWYNTDIYPEEWFENVYYEWNYDFESDEFDQKNLSGFEDIPEFIKDILDDEDDNQSSS